MSVDVCGGVVVVADVKDELVPVVSPSRKGNLAVAGLGVVLTHNEPQAVAVDEQVVRPRDVGAAEVEHRLPRDGRDDLLVGAACACAGVAVVEVREDQCALVVGDAQGVGDEGRVDAPWGAVAREVAVDGADGLRGWLGECLVPVDRYRVGDRVQVGGANVDVTVVERRAVGVVEGRERGGDDV